MKEVLYVVKQLLSLIVVCMSLTAWRKLSICVYSLVQWRTQEFFSWGVEQFQLRTEDRENEDLGAVAP